MDPDMCDPKVCRRAPRLCDQCVEADDCLVLGVHK